MASELACPKCQSEDTRKISQIIKLGTRETEVQIGMKHGSATETTAIAEEFGYRLKDAISGEPGGGEGENLYGGAMMLSAISGIITFAVKNQSHSVDASFYGIAVGIGVFILLVILLRKSGQSTELVASFNYQKKWLDNGCYCNRCGAKYIPGSDEQYKF